MSLSTFFRGIVVGVVIGVLVAPDSGAKTRRRLSRRAGEIKDTVLDTYDEIASNVTDKINQVKSKASDIMGKKADEYDDFIDDTETIYEP